MELAADKTVIILPKISEGSLTLQITQHSSTFQLLLSVGHTLVMTLWLSHERPSICRRPRLGSEQTCFGFNAPTSDARITKRWITTWPY